MSTTSSELTTPAASIAEERVRVAHQLSLLATEVAPRDSAVAEILGRLVIAVRQGKAEETRGYVEAIELRALAELLVTKRTAFWPIVEIARNVLVFAPIAVTWFALSTASAAYASLIAIRPALVSQPFLLLWQQDFPGVGAPLNFSTLATIDAGLIGLLIILSLMIHIRSEIGDVTKRTQALLKESQMRALLGHAVAVCTAVEIGSETADAVLDQMVAEERRIYERAMEREQQLFDLEGAVVEIRRAATELARAAEALDRTKTRS